MSSEFEGPNDTALLLSCCIASNDVNALQRTGNEAVVVKIEEVSGYLLDRLRNKWRWILTRIDGVAAEIRIGHFPDEIRKHCSLIKLPMCSWQERQKYFLNFQYWLFGYEQIISAL